MYTSQAEKNTALDWHRADIVAALHKQGDGADYYNCGAWIDERLTYITVGEDGVQIHEYSEQTDSAEKDKADRGFHFGEQHSLPDFELVDFADEVGTLEDSEYQSVGR